MNGASQPVIRARRHSVPIDETSESTAMEITDLALATTLVAVVATAIACLVVTVHTFVRAAREARRESRPEGRLLYGTFDLQTAAPHDAVAERRATR